MKLGSWWPLFLVLLLQIIFLSQIQFIAWPEMLYEPYLMNHGFTIYQNITIAHAPLLLFFLQLAFKIIRDPVLGLKIFTWGLSLSTTLLIYCLSQKLFAKRKGISLAAALAYVFLHVYFEGNGVWFDHLVSVFSLVSFYFFYRFLFVKGKRKEIFLAGLFLGLAGISKQTAGWLVVPALVGFLLGLFKTKKLIRTIKEGLLFSCGCLLPWLAVAGWLATKEAAADFWFWAFHFGITVLPQASGQIQFPTYRQLAATLLPFLVLVPLWFQAKLSRPKKVLITFWTIFAALGIYPRFERFHFQPALPLLGLVYGLTLTTAKTRKLALVAVILFLPLWWRTVFNLWGLPDRFLEEDVRKAVSWLKANTEPEQPIYVFNSWDHFYALADRPAAVDPVPPTLKWYLELPGLQEELIKSLAQKKDPVIIVEEYKETGLGAYKPEKLDEYIKTQFEQKEIVADRFIIWEKR